MYELDKKQRRLLLLNKETRLYQDNCSNCRFKASNLNENCLKCPIYKQLRAIGDELSQLNKFEFKPSKEEKKVGLTVERYQQLKGKGYTDKRIREEFGMSHTKFYQWKNEQGLTGKETTQVDQQEVIKENDIFPQKAKPIDQVSVDAETLQKEIKQLRTENDKLKEDIKEQIVEIESLEEKVQVYEEEIEKYKQKLSLHAKRMTELGSLNRAIKERNEELLLKIAELESSSGKQDVPQTLRKLTMALLEYAIETTKTG